MVGVNPERVRRGCDQHGMADPFRVATKYATSLSQGFKANPGLELANTFGVKTLSEKQEVVGSLRRLHTHKRN
jgi:hypothetical protein